MQLSRTRSRPPSFLCLDAQTSEGQEHLQSLVSVGHGKDMMEDSTNNQSDDEESIYKLYQCLCEHTISADTRHTRMELTHLFSGLSAGQLTLFDFD